MKQIFSVIGSVLGNLHGIHAKVTAVYKVWCLIYDEIKPLLPNTGTEAPASAEAPQG